MFSYLKKFSAAFHEGGKPVPLQLLEALQLRLCASPLGIGEYLDYGVWHRSITPAMRNEFIGWRQSSKLDKLLNNDSSRILANDKLINYLILRSAGYPIPLTIATYTIEGRKIANEIVLKTLGDLKKFLDDNIYPVYVKPISAGYGRGVVGLKGRNSKSFCRMDGKLISHDEFMAPFNFPSYRGMLFQKPLIAHPSVAELTGSDAISCIRFICFVTSSGPIIHTAFWKIVAGQNMLDNFSHGHFGNCLGAIELKSGEVVRAIHRMGPGGMLSEHPTTKKPLIGFTLPDWSKARDLVLSASKHFPGLRLQNWDVALCTDGPVLLELNTESELNVPQAISGRGFNDYRLHKILEDINREDDAIRKSALSLPPTYIQ
jgi:hypothetical protein